ncbi:MAG: GTPase [Methylococcales bacterium]
MKATTAWIALIILSATPFLLLMAAGGVWIYENKLVLPWVAATLLSSLAGFGINRYLKKKSAKPKTLHIDAEKTWPGRGSEAWTKVEALSEQIQKQDPDLDNASFYWNTLKDVMQTVALHFYPERKDAILELRVPYLLRVIELLSKDMRIAFSENVPGSQIVTINDVLRGQRLASKGNTLLKLSRIVAAGVDPISAAIREIGLLATDSLISDSTKEIKSWLLDAYVKKIGYYAIELYSGHLVLDDQAFAESSTKASQTDQQTALGREEQLQQEPLRILIVGQISAGKSSLINALFKQRKAASDILPQTVGIQPYLLEQDGINKAIILDTTGYQDNEESLNRLSDIGKAVIQCDLIIMVCAANNPARQADKKILTSLRRQFQEKTGENPPPIIIALSHIDKLRPFRDWTPPYDIINPTTPKAVAIKSAIEVTAQALALSISQIVPVNLNKGFEYNVEEGLIPTIIQNLDEAERLKYLRCLEGYRKTEQWQALWRQSKNAGRFIAKKGIYWLTNVK